MHYDSDNSSNLSQVELVKMMVDAGMRHATDAEAKFVHDYISQSSPYITPTTFLNWAKSYKGMG